MKWKLRVRDEGGISQLAWWETKQLDSEDDALEEAWEMMYGRTGQRHLKVITFKDRTVSGSTPQILRRGVKRARLGSEANDVSRPEAIRRLV